MTGTLQETVGRFGVVHLCSEKKNQLRSHANSFIQLEAVTRRRHPEYRMYIYGKCSDDIAALLKTKTVGQFGQEKKTQ